MFRLSCTDSALETQEILNKQKTFRTNEGNIVLHIVNSKLQDFITSLPLPSLQGPIEQRPDPLTWHFQSTCPPILIFLRWRGFICFLPHPSHSHLKLDGVLDAEMSSPFLSNISLQVYSPFSRALVASSLLTSTFFTPFSKIRPNLKITLSSKSLPFHNHSVHHYFLPSLPCLHQPWL